MWEYITAILLILLGLLYKNYSKPKPKEEPLSLDLVLKIRNTDVLRSSIDRKIPSKTTKSGIPMLLYYYSQTGTSEDFAKRFGQECENRGFSIVVTDVEAVETEEFLEEAEGKLVVFFASTYGEGDPPDAAVSFHEWLMSQDRDMDSTRFSTIKFSVFGLGNKSYDHYNEVGKQIYRRLKELGATPLFDLGLGDDEENIENDYLVWKKAAIPAICQEYKLTSAESNEAATLHFRQKMVIHSEDECSKISSPVHHIERWHTSNNANPEAKSTYLGTISTCKELYSEKADRSCLHVEIQTGGALKYKSGYHIGIFPENDRELVEELASLLNLQLDTVVSMKQGDTVLVGPCTVRALLTQYYDIAFYAKKYSIQVLAQFATDPEEKKTLSELCSDDPDKQGLFNSYVVQGNRTIAEVMKDYPSSRPPPEHVLESLPKLQCRFYSISSSPLTHPETVHITAAVTEWITPTTRKAKGVATTWLSSNRPSTDLTVKIPCYIRSSHFLPPDSLSTPFIMIGPGTGLAPFRAFLQERQHLLSLPENKNIPVGECHLFFGCRNPEHDYMYKEELESYVADGTLTKLHLAFSRIQEHKVYVQHKMMEPETSKKIWEILENKGRTYICGDATSMAGDVTNTLHEIITKEGNMTREEAKAYFSKLTSEGRHHADVW